MNSSGELDRNPPRLLAVSGSRRCARAAADLDQYISIYFSIKREHNGRLNELKVKNSRRHLKSPNCA